MNISTNSNMTFYEKPEKKAVNYLLTVLNAELWAKCYIPDDDFNKKQKLENTVKYLKNVIKNNYVLKVDYFKSDKDTLGIGRQYGNGIQNIPSAFRGLLFRENTTDIDMINAHPTLLRHLCLEKNIPTPNLENYCFNRDQLIADGEATKKEIVVSMYSSEPISTSSQFMRYFDIEMKTIKQILWNDPEFKYIRESINIHKTNKMGTFLAYLLQSMERNVLGYVREFMDERKIEICADMFDGLLVYGNFGEELIYDLNGYVLFKSGIGMRFSTKPHDTSIQIPEDFVFSNDEEIYASLKLHYETEKCLSFIECNSTYSYKNGNNIIFLKKGDMAQTLQPIKVGKKRFFDMWCDDTSRKTFQSIGMYPHDVECPPNVFNLWDGFTVERMPDCESADLSPIFKHLRILTNHEEAIYEFILDWLANMFQYPSQQSPVPVIYSDAGGTGKSSLIRLIREMVGYDKSMVIEDVKNKLFGSFNGHLQNMFFINIDEPDPKEMSRNHELLKNLTDGSDISIHNKGVTAFTIPNTLHIIGTTNNDNAFKIKEGERRFFPFECSEELRGNSEYFIEFHSLIKNQAILKTFHKFLLERKVKKRLTHIDFPESEMLEEVMEVNSDVYKDFFETLGTGTYKSYELYTMFRQFCMSSGMREEWIVTKKLFIARFSKYAKKQGIVRTTAEEKELCEDGRTKRSKFYWFMIK